MQRRPTTQDVSWFLDLHSRNQLDLEPPYQRRSVWTPRDRRYFLDTIFRNYSCPSIFLHKTIDEGGTAKYHVVDGKQRIETIIMFVDNKISLDKDIGDTRLAGKKWKKLDDDQKEKFWNYIFTVEMLGTVEAAIVDEIFARVNRNSRKLERQELRHAKYDGWFINYVESESEKDEWKELNVVTTSRAKRMKDVQFLSELFFLVLDNKIVGFDQDYLDTNYAKYDNPQETLPNFSEEDFSEKIERIKTYLLKMEKKNECLTKYAKGFGNLYSLWAVVALNLEALRAPSTLAIHYQEFMDKVLEITAQERPEELLSGKNAELYREPYNYYIYSLGPVTDLPLRERRNIALKSALLKSKK
jgi:hypothetical protein